MIFDAFNALNDSEMSTLEEFNEAVEAGLYNKFTRYGKMTMHVYRNEQFLLKILSSKRFFKQGSDETLFCIAFARFVSGFQLNGLFTYSMFDFHDANDRQYFQ
jgi:hypothetical protein